MDPISLQVRSQSAKRMSLPVLQNKPIIENKECMKGCGSCPSRGCFQRVSEEKKSKETLLTSDILIALSLEKNTSNLNDSTNTKSKNQKLLNSQKSAPTISIKNQIVFDFTLSRIQNLHETKQQTNYSKEKTKNFQIHEIALTPFPNLSINNSTDLSIIPVSSKLAINQIPESNSLNPKNRIKISSSKSNIKTSIAIQFQLPNGVLQSLPKELPVSVFRTEEFVESKVVQLNESQKLVDQKSLSQKLMKNKINKTDNSTSTHQIKSQKISLQKTKYKRTKSAFVPQPTKTPFILASNLSAPKSKKEKISNNKNIPQKTTNSTQIIQIKNTPKINTSNSQIKNILQAKFYSLRQKNIDVFFKKTIPVHLISKAAIKWFLLYSNEKKIRKLAINLLRFLGRLCRFFIN